MARGNKGDRPQPCGLFCPESGAASCRATLQGSGSEPRNVLLNRTQRLSDPPPYPDITAGGISPAPPLPPSRGPEEYHLSLKRKMQRNFRIPFGGTKTSCPGPGKSGRPGPDQSGHKAAQNPPNVQDALRGNARVAALRGNAYPGHTPDTAALRGNASAHAVRGNASAHAVRGNAYRIALPANAFSVEFVDNSPKARDNLWITPDLAVDRLLITYPPLVDNLSEFLYRCG